MFLSDVKARHGKMVESRTSFGAVSRKPKAVPTLVCELYGLAEEEISIVEGERGG